MGDEEAHATKRDGSKSSQIKAECCAVTITFNYSQRCYCGQSFDHRRGAHISRMDDMGAIGECANDNVWQRTVCIRYYAYQHDSVSLTIPVSCSEQLIKQSEYRYNDTLIPFIDEVTSLLRCQSLDQGFDGGCGLVAFFNNQTVSVSCCRQ